MISSKALQRFELESEINLGLSTSHYEHVSGPRRGRAVWGLSTDKHNLEVSDSKPFKYALPSVRLLSTVQAYGVMSVYGSAQRLSPNIAGCLQGQRFSLRTPAAVTEQFRGLPQSLQANAGTASKIEQRPLLSILFINSTFVKSFHAVYPEIMRSSLNKPEINRLTPETSNGFV
jgi:hypothetical protein